MAAALAPVATTALSTFSSSPASAAANASSPRSYASPDQFLGAMSLNRLLTATALVDAGTAGKLCTMFNKAVGAAGDITAEAAVVLSHIDPDLQHAVLDVVTAQPPGCQLDWSGECRLPTLLAVMQKRTALIPNTQAKIATADKAPCTHHVAMGVCCILNRTWGADSARTHAMCKNMRGTGHPCPAV